jgi:hypothetical protein
MDQELANKLASETEENVPPVMSTEDIPRQPPLIAKQDIREEQLLNPEYHAVANEEDDIEEQLLKFAMENSK